MRRPVSFTDEARIVALAAQHAPRLKYREIAALTSIPAGTIGCIIQRAIHEGRIAGRHSHNAVPRHVVPGWIVSISDGCPVAALL